MLIAINDAALKAVVFDRLASDAAGAAARAILAVASAAALGGRIVDAQALSRAVPAAPFLALRRGPRPTVEGSIGAAYYYWFIYDDPARTSYDSNRLVQAIAQAYVAPLVFNGAPLAPPELLIGDESTDRVLNLLVTKLTLTVYC